ncbi:MULTISPECIES: hypothetical protein [Streptomyces]|uniref:Uncharacterized protein n=1 Tax=Streptomyces viridochromogenes TaxID=1938 RepID=A0A0L8KQS0_STRVR|nr:MULTISPECIES: hypothetical protein [Streptomyces]KOG28298.1 hypothetical protein ADK34_13805 [Streptomyces viridochromogenes]
MAAHAAAPAGRRISTHGWGGPVAVGVLYGLYAATVARHGGPTTLGQLWLGLISAIVLAVSIRTLHRHGRALPRELHAAAWGSLSGIAVGFLFSLSDASILSSSGLGLAFGTVNAAGAYYMYYTHEDAQGRPAPY